MKSKKRISHLCNTAILCIEYVGSYNSCERENDARRAIDKSRKTGKVVDLETMKEVE